jgi:hypothetical protein
VTAPVPPSPGAAGIPALAPHPVEEDLLQQIATLNQSVWEHRVGYAEVVRWLDNFADDSSERLHALFLLSQFLYFGDQEVRALLRSVFQDLVRYPFIENFRRQFNDTRDQVVLDEAFVLNLERTRFLGVGNASESGPHLLYYFRQENRLPKRLFKNAYELLDGVGTPEPRLRERQVAHYVFVDDFCGTGHQASDFWTQVVQHVVASAQRAQEHIRTSYFSLVARSDALRYLKANTGFDDVAAVISLDESFECFHTDSRYFRGTLPAGVSRKRAHEMCLWYGTQLSNVFCALGYGDCQLLIGFHHNTPDNTLPIFWGGYDEAGWRPIFRRFGKK